MALTESIEVLRAAARGYLAGMEAADATCDVFSLESLYEYSDEVTLLFHAFGDDEDGARVLRVRALPTGVLQSDEDHVIVLELREDEV